MIVFAAQLNPVIGDLAGNTHKVVQALRRAREKRADIVLFPELVLSGYFPDDLLLDKDFIAAIEKQLEMIAPETKGMFAVVGLPRRNPQKKEKPLLNSAAVFIDGDLKGFKNKTLLPTYDVFDERRFFESESEQPVWEYKGKKIGIAICEDAWQHTHHLEDYTDYQLDPIIELKRKKIDLLLNLSASPYFFKRGDVRISVFSEVAKTAGCPVVFCNQVGGNDQLIFDGYSFCVDPHGELVQRAKGFEEEDLIVDLDRLKKEKIIPTNPIGDLYQALVLGVKDYMHKQGFKKGLVGLSGGIDSALVACIGRDALGAKNMLFVTLPSRYSSKGSVEDSAELAKILGVQLLDISIEPIFRETLSVLEPMLFSGDLMEENLQPRIRAMILMAFSNKFGSILLNASNKSELAMGYCTLYGDMAGGIGVLQDVFKLRVYELAEYIGIIPKSILEKAPSAELRENQIDTDVLPRYEILDPILEDYIEERLSAEEIAKKRHQSLEFVREIIRKVHLAEYKRRQAPMGIRVSKKAFDKGRFIPIVQKWV